MGGAGNLYEVLRAMPVIFRNALLVLTVIVISGLGRDASAQCLIFRLPEDGKGVEYKGKITYTTVRADIAEGKEEITKDREISIRSVGVEDAMFEGAMQPCRWIEIKTITGTDDGAGIDPGPVGSRIYKVLVPESKILGTAVDADAIPNIVLPIVKGYRRTGETQVRPMKSQAIAFYPTICQLTNYPEPEVVAASEAPPAQGADQYPSKHLKGRKVMERPESRSTNEAHFWVSDQIPFGLAHWEVTVTQERKESTAPRDNYEEVSTTTCQMSIRRVLEVVQSDLIIPDGI